MAHEDPATASYSPAGPRPLGARATHSGSAPSYSGSRARSQSVDDTNQGSIDSPAGGGGGWSRKRRWLTTLITPIAVLVMAVGGHRAWTWQAERKLGALVDELRRKGEPVSMAEITPKVARQDNAAFDIRAASEGLPNDSELWQQFFGLGPLSLPLTQQELHVLRPVIAENQDAFALIRTAMTKPGIDWAATISLASTQPAGASSPPWGGRSYGFFRTRSLAQLLYAATLLAEQDGDQSAALAHVEEMLFLARASASRPMIRSQLAGLRFYDVSLLALGEILPDVAQRSQDAAAPADGADGDRHIKHAPAARVSAIVAGLLDERDARDAILRCLRSERARCIEALLSPASEAGNLPSAFAGATENSPWSEPLPLPWPGGTWERMLSRPVYLSRAQQGIERLNLAIAAFDAADLNEFMQAFAENPAPRVDSRGDAVDEDGDNGYTRSLTTAVQGAARIYYAGLAHRRTTAVALAIAQYHAEHGDWPPADMARMFPRFLPEMPADPLSSAGEHIIYLPDRGGRPRVYSVGEDGIDDAGQPAPNIISRPEDYRSTDWVVDLVRQPRRIWTAWPGRG
jgi:hypothetical protein